MRKIVLSIFAVLTMCLGAMAQDLRITGTVVDADGQPVLAATVAVVGTTTATITNWDGTYEISAAKNATLEFSYVGMATQQVAVAGRTTINVTLQQDATQIEDVVIIGYGSGVAAKSVVGSVASVKGEKLENAPVANVSDVLQGKIPGLQVYTSSGEPSEGSSMMMRGMSSINASSSPLVIMDGVPVSENVFLNTNSNDIESVVLLKDAASTSIYGARAANGVLYITTKKGRVNERSMVQVRVQGGFSSMIENTAFDLMTGAEQMRFESQLYPQLLQDPEWVMKMAVVEATDFSFDWKGYAYQSNAPMTGIDGSISGSSGNTNYYISFGYLDTEGIAPRSNNTRYTFRTNLDSKVKDWLKVGVNIGLSYTEYQRAVTGWYTSSVDGLVYGQAPYNAPYEMTIEYPTSPEDTGRIVLNYDKELKTFDFAGDITNPYYYYSKFPTANNDVSLSGNSFFEFTPISGLTIKAVQAIDAADYRSSAQRLPSYDIGNYLGNGQSQESFSRYCQMTATNTAEYRFSIGDNNHVTALIGQEAIVAQSSGFAAGTEGTADDRLILMTAGLSEMDYISSHSIVDQSYNSVFARATFNHNDLYHFDASVRADGSSKFGKDARWGTFWSVGGMWNIRNEEFMAHRMDIDDMRLKVSYGTTGNSSISNYLALGLIGSGVEYAGVSGTGIASAANSGLTWETTKSFNIGYSVRMYNRLNFEMDVYNRTIDNMLMNIPYSATTGYSSGWGNVGEMRNTGIELQLGYTLVQTQNLFWNIYGNVAYNHNEIVELYGNQTEYVEGSTGLKYAVGHSMGEFFGVRSAGVDPRDGNPMWYDLAGNKTKVYSEANSDWMDMNFNADWSGGFGTSLQWGNLLVSADFSWVGERWMWLNEKFYTANLNFGAVGQNHYESRMADMWTTPGQVTDIPKAGTAFQFDDTVYSNAAFLRLKNLTVSYDIPAEWLGGNQFVQGARIYMIGRNLLTFTNYLGFDPEYFGNGSAGTYPGTRQYTFGFELSF